VRYPTGPPRASIQRRNSQATTARQTSRHEYGAQPRGAGIGRASSRGSSSSWSAPQLDPLPCGGALDRGDGFGVIAVDHDQQRRPIGGAPR
jgi:hypothetical protein